MKRWEHGEAGWFIHFIYVDRYHDGFYQKAPHAKQQHKETLRRVDRLPHDEASQLQVHSERIGAFGGHAGFVVAVNRGNLRAIQIVRMPLVRRIRCGFCGEIADVPPDEDFPRPVLEGDDIPRWPALI